VTLIPVIDSSEEEEEACMAQAAFMNARIS
jgi:hypothetical protein